MVSYSAKLDSRTKQHTQFGVSASNGSRDMARTKVAEKRKKMNIKQSHIASPTGIANKSIRNVSVYTSQMNTRGGCFQKNTSVKYQLFTAILNRVNKFS